MATNRAKTTFLAALTLGTAALLLSRLKDGHRQAERRLGSGKAGSTRHRVVVVGAGFGGLNAARPLAGLPGVDLTLIDARNHHLFQPLLYQVATSALSPADIAVPVRTIMPPSESLRVLMATVTGVDVPNRLVLCGDDTPVPYEHLVLATGSAPSYFGHAEWETVAPALKTLDDALRLRNAIMSAFERAATTDVPQEQSRWLTFVLIGGGPTGVEMAGAIGQFVQDRLERAYNLAGNRARIILIEAGSRVLAGFAPDLSDRAAAELESLGVQIRTNTRVTSIEPGLVKIADETIAAETVIWTAGTKATPVASWLAVKPGHGGRVEVGTDLRVPSHNDIFVIGDASLMRAGNGHPLPGLAPVAKQQGAYVAESIRRALLTEPAQRPFQYRDYGILATVGRNKAVAQFGNFRLHGFPAWLTWAGAHIAFLISFRSRVIVSLEWAFAYATHGQSAGLIIGDGSFPGRPPRASPGSTELARSLGTETRK